MSSNVIKKFFKNFFVLLFIKNFTTFKFLNIANFFLKGTPNFLTPDLKSTIKSSLLPFQLLDQLQTTNYSPRISANCPNQGSFSPFNGSLLYLTNYKHAPEPFLEAANGYSNAVELPFREKSLLFHNSQFYLCRVANVSENDCNLN